MASRRHKVKGEATKWLEKFVRYSLRYYLMGLAGSMVIWLCIGYIYLEEPSGFGEAAVYMLPAQLIGAYTGGRAGELTQKYVFALAFGVIVTFPAWMIIATAFEG